MFFCLFCVPKRQLFLLFHFGWCARSHKTFNYHRKNRVCIQFLQFIGFLIVCWCCTQPHWNTIFVHYRWRASESVALTMLPNANVSLQLAIVSLLLSNFIILNCAVYDIATASKLANLNFKHRKTLTDNINPIFDHKPTNRKQLNRISLEIQVSFNFPGQPVFYLVDLSACSKLLESQPRIKFLCFRHQIDATTSEIVLLVTCVTASHYVSCIKHQQMIIWTCPHLKCHLIVVDTCSRIPNIFNSKTPARYNVHPNIE